MLFSLKGKVAIVTGAGSRRGIGRSIALALAEQGADVIVCDVNLEGAKETSAEVVQEKGVRSEAYQVNVIDQSEIKACVEAVISKYGRIDILVNNAGITQPKKVLDITEEEWDRILAVNLKGTFLFSKAVAPYMIEKNYGRIISMSSVSAKRGGGVFGGAHY
ncbi:MAG TPA: SDR family NAD(P)-dependent oxidoreductase, partial [Rectinema sp.]|nr:SDR family NAD(P)-dependent oxidoreductase [Rectinema sp.]